MVGQLVQGWEIGHESCLLCWCLVASSNKTCFKCILETEIFLTICCNIHLENTNKFSIKCDQIYTSELQA